MGVYIDGLEATKTGSMRIQLYDDGTVWVFNGFGCECQEKKYTEIDLVRCGECIHRVEDSDFQSGHFCLKRRSNGGLYCEDDDFCSYGERRMI